MPLSAKLVVVGGEVKTAEIKLRLPSTIGRGRGATIMLPHPLVSRTHCELFEAGGRLMVRDMGSLNGTFINNERVTEAPLPPGELLTVGTVTFRAVYDAEESSSGPPSGQAPKMKAPRASDTEFDPTLRAVPPKKADPTPLPAEAAEFDFAQPLVDFGDDDEDLAKTPLPPQRQTESGRSEATIEDLDVAEVEVVEEPPESAPAKPAAKPVPAMPPMPAAAAAKPAAASSPPAKPTPVAKPTPAPAPAAKPAAPAPASPVAAKDERTVADPGKWDDAEEVASPEDDDDFNDFLKSLGK